MSAHVRLSPEMSSTLWYSVTMYPLFNGRVLQGEMYFCSRMCSLEVMKIETSGSRIRLVKTTGCFYSTGWQAWPRTHTTVAHAKYYGGVVLEQTWGARWTITGGRGCPKYELLHSLRNPTKQSDPRNHSGCGGDASLGTVIALQTMPLPHNTVASQRTRKCLTFESRNRTMLSVVGGLFKLCLKCVYVFV